MIYNRQSKKYIKEKEYKEDTLKKLYGTKYGRILLKTIIARPYFNKLVRLYKCSSISCKDIVPFIKKYKIRLKDYDLRNIKSFNDFFIRKRYISNNSKENELVAIADAKLLMYNIDDDLKLNIKNSVYTLEEILGDGELASKFSEGTCLVFRLTVDDYHRYHYLDSGCTMLNYKIPGELHTVRPIASKYKVFSRNCREVTYMNTYNFGEVVQVEVGATLVGCIKNKNNIYFNKLEEKGHFEYGCSTILLILNKDAMIDQDIVYHSKQGIETKVSIGDKIGYIERKN